MNVPETLKILPDAFHLTINRSGAESSYFSGNISRNIYTEKFITTKLSVGVSHKSYL
jgi:hypothetical protein